MQETSGHLDLGYLEEMTGGDHEFIGELLATYLETAPDLVEAIGVAARTRDQEKAVYAAHTLKGSSRSIGAEPIGKLCQDLEQAARSGEMAAFQALVPKVEEGFSALRRTIEGELRKAA